MKKPKTYEGLLELVNPLDLLEILGFSGVNDWKERNPIHYKLKREFYNNVSKSIHTSNWYEWKDPSLYYFKEGLTDAHYDTIVKCIQDFYYWSRDFCHIYAHIYKRVINALEISMDDIKQIYEIKKRYDNEKNGTS